MMLSNSEMISFPVSVDRSERYSIVIGTGLLGRIGDQIRALGTPTPVHVITDTHVNDLYGSQLLESLWDANIKAEVLTVEQGETSKSLLVADYLYQQLLSVGAARRDIIIALGGGVVMDLAGFVAATYMRGISYLNLPTSLMAQLDASIGGKVGINHAHGKNLIGAFHHPRAVYIDPVILSTLPPSEIRNGLAEAIKVAIIHSEPLFEFIEARHQELLGGDISSLTRLITESVKAKLDLLSPDPFETDLKRTLNFGHTIGHLLETLMAYSSLSHGQAISIGMAVATRLAVSKGLCERKVADRIIALLDQIGLPIHASKVDLQAAQDGLRLIEAVRGRALNFVVPTGIGSCIILDGLSFDLVIKHF